MYYLVLLLYYCYFFVVNVFFILFLRNQPVQTREQLREKIMSIATRSIESFDYVNHDILLAKSERLCYCGMVKELLQSCLRNRTQTVYFSKEFSKEFNISRRVPQDSILGPFLFLVYISHLPQMVQCHSMLFNRQRYYHLF